MNKPDGNRVAIGLEAVTLTIDSETYTYDLDANEWLDASGEPDEMLNIAPQWIGLGEYVIDPRIHQFGYLEKLTGGTIDITYRYDDSPNASKGVY
jgi:hypothetical protein